MGLFNLELMGNVCRLKKVFDLLWVVNNVVVFGVGFYVGKFDICDGVVKMFK